MKDLVPVERITGKIYFIRGRFTVKERIKAYGQKKG
jgi:hypothetical protein